jgi:hypothetical protein
MIIYGSKVSILHGNEQLYALAASTLEFVRMLTGFVTKALQIHDMAVLTHALNTK